MKVLVETNRKTKNLINKSVDMNSCHCDVVCYREREGEVNSLTLLYLNQQALGLTVKAVGERRSSYPHSVTCSLLNKGRSLGQSS